MAYETIIVDIEDHVATIKLNRPEGTARCTASAGKFEVLLERDFGAVDPRRLEVAVRAFLDALKD